MVRLVFPVDLLTQDKLDYENDNMTVCFLSLSLSLSLITLCHSSTSKK